MNWLRDIGAFIAGGLGTAGSLWQSRENIKQAREQMAFQERMSSTAVQRSVEDYKKAGLNPALAYERSASSPGGISANIGNPIEAGSASATAFRNTSEAVATARQQREIAARMMTLTEKTNFADLQLKGAQVDQTRQSAMLNEVNAVNALETQGWLRALQPHQLRLARAQALLEHLKIPGAENTAGFERLIGRARPGISSALGAARLATELTNLIRGRR